MNSDNILNRIFNDHGLYKEAALNAELIRHRDLSLCINSLRNKNLFGIGTVGKSVEGRDIFSIEFGEGKTVILAWSQMHGDEPTATAALFDVMNFFLADDPYSDFRNKLMKELKFHFIPLLNPDGAEIFRRENAFNIDINRDAGRLESDESKILWEYAGKIEPEFCFNLHDQNSYYTAGRSKNHSTISLLAPPSDHVKSINYAREKSMQVIVDISAALNNFIPGQIARYNDEHEPRAFGDNFIRRGFSSILIESGFQKSDPGKEYVRKLNFIALLSAFESISEKKYQKINYADYFSIPENRELLFDLLLRNVSLKSGGKNFRIDIGINRKKGWDSNAQNFTYAGTIKELGDLSIYSGIEEHDMSGYSLASSDKISADTPAELIMEGKDKIFIKNGFFIKES